MHLPANKKLTFHYPVERGLQRFRELIVYISQQSRQDSQFGAVKLNKILYFSDFMAFERLGQPLTGMVYQKLEHGPAPRAMVPVLRELIEEKVIAIETVFVFGKPQKRTVALRPAITSLFFADELALIDEVISELEGQGASDVSYRSHDLRWKAVQLNDSIPYEFIYFDPRELTAEDVTRSHELAREFGWQ